MSVRRDGIQGVAPIAICDDFLDPATHGELVAWTLANEIAFEQSVVGVERQNDRAIRSSRWVPGDQFNPWRKHIREVVRPLLPELAAAAGIDPFEPARLEVQLVAHNDGDFYNTHIDTAIGAEGAASATRMLSMVYYFHTEPQGFSGGSLRIHSFSPSSGAHFDVAPRQNRLVAFIPWALHEVLPISCASGAFADSRFAINIWAHRAEA